MQIRDLITPKRITICLSVSSKKRMLEELSALLHRDQSDVDQNAAFQSLVERERLGSTGIGKGVALPHARVKGLKRPMGAFATLAQRMDYDSADGEPINMAFALLVPEHASEEHLQMLSVLAELFSNKNLRERLSRATTPQEIYGLLVDQNDAARRKAG